MIPAAGRSVRMGTHKLLMPWNGMTVIDTVLTAWQESLVGQIVIVARRDDAQLLEALANRPLEILKLDSDSLDMKQSIQLGLQHIQKIWKPSPDDACLIAPADIPKLTAKLIDAVIDEYDGDQIVTAVYGPKNGHPTCFPWHTTSKIFELAANEGMDSLIKRSQTKRICFDLSSRPRDIDTPEDYQRELDCS